MESIICVANKILASCSNESLIRFWDFENSDNFVLDIEPLPIVKIEEEVVACIAYNPETSRWKKYRI